MPIRVYNTLSGVKEPFEPIAPPKVGMYVCGPTVYSNSHIGHMVGPVIFDTIKRFLVYRGYEVTWVVNITDVDDKLIVQANKDGISVKALAERVTADYLNCLSALAVDGVDHMPRATEYIAEIISITTKLIEQGVAYPSGGDVYFDVGKAPDYGKLSHRNPEDLKAGARVETTDVKRHPADFALWKGSKPDEPWWESPWGRGRPGWHIECSAMSMKLLGESFDIHGGGLDLVFPHHENEVAQSECCSGRPFAKYWLHNGLLTKDGKKISKSDPDTIVLMGDLLKQHHPDTLRTLLVASHYRSPIDYGTTRLDEIARGLTAFRNLFDRFERLTGESFYALTAAKRDKESAEPGLAEVGEHRDRFLQAMDDDFNTGAALGELYETVRALNRFVDASKLDSETRSPESLAPFRAGVVALKEMTQILGLFRIDPPLQTSTSDTLTPALLDLFVKLRTQVRKEKNFALADQIRNDLAALGVVLEDRAGGTGWKIDGRVG